MLKSQITMHLNDDNNSSFHSEYSENYNTTGGNANNNAGRGSISGVGSIKDLILINNK